MSRWLPLKWPDLRYVFDIKETMKRALIAIASVGILVPAAWAVEANAQQMAPVSPPSQALRRRRTVGSELRITERKVIGALASLDTPEYELQHDTAAAGLGIRFSALDRLVKRWRAADEEGKYGADAPDDLR